MWAEAVKCLDGKETVVFSTTSSAQRKNWEKLFKQAGRHRVAGGLVKTANSYNPGITSHWVNLKKAAGENINIRDYKNNIQIYLQEHTSKCKDDLYFLSIVDEAHALIDTVKAQPGVFNGGHELHAGPQGWHIIRSSRITIFLLDTNQSFKDNETTAIDDLYNYANEFNAHIEHIKLEDAQFRCGGSIEYVNWLDKLLELNIADNNSIYFQNKFIFEIVRDPFELENKLRNQISNGKTARLAATYSREWKTKKNNKPHELEDIEKDFCIDIIINNESKKWSKIWNYVPNEDYTVFIQAPPESVMHKDPLAEIGCPYVLRGFDFDFIGLLWLKDLVWRDNHWVADPKHSFDTAFNITRPRAIRNGKESNDYKNFLEKTLRSYRILLTRPLRGIYIWFEDEETKQHVLELLKNHG